jgi:hypothetical protein
MSLTPVARFTTHTCIDHHLDILHFCFCRSKRVFSFRSCRSKEDHVCGYLYLFFIRQSYIACTACIKQHKIKTKHQCGEGDRVHAERGVSCAWSAPYSIIVGFAVSRPSGSPPAPRHDRFWRKKAMTTRVYVRLRLVDAYHDDPFACPPVVIAYHDLFRLATHSTSHIWTRSAVIGCTQASRS